MKYIMEAVIIIILSGACWYAFFYYREKRLLEKMMQMVIDTRNGALLRGEISETKFSALENSMKRYMDDSMLASENQEAQKTLIQGLISDISHQTLTPLSNLKIYSDLLREQTGSYVNIKDSAVNVTATVDTIAGQVEKLEFLIQSLVKLSRMENGIITVHPQQTALSELFCVLKSQYQIKAKEKNLQIEICETELVAQFDLKWTSEALGNILDNAIKYTKEGGSVKISAMTYSLFVRIDISDTGIGISEEELPKVFQRFYRSIAASEYPGVGLGLYLSREIIQAQKGYIKVISEEGEGATFSIFLQR